MCRRADVESDKPQVTAVVVRELAREYSNWRASGDLGDWRDPIYSNQLQMRQSGLTILKFRQPQGEVLAEMPATSQFLKRAA